MAQSGALSGNLGSVGRRRLPLLSLLLLLLAGGAAAARQLTAYEQLEAHGLPPNLLPETVVNYTLFDSGAFIVRLEKECYATVLDGQIPVYYAPTLTGVMGTARLSYLKGISVKPPQYRWFWLQVLLIYIDTTDIHIGVGLGLQEALPLEQFSPDHPVCEDRSTTPGPLAVKRPAYKQSRILRWLFPGKVDLPS